MYSGTTLHNKSGAVIGTHQKINRLARNNLADMIDVSLFPPLKTIQYFEGKNGPDGIKAKSPAKDEPWHYYNPFGTNEELLNLIQEHFEALIYYLKDNNEERAAFEASWLSHALVDGLTPAHHYPYEEELKRLRAGEELGTRNSLKEKLVMKGDTRGQQFINNWKMWGAKGLFTTHAQFEMGVAFLVAPLNLRYTKPNKTLLQLAVHKGIVDTFQVVAQEVADRGMYQRFYVRGWTTRLAREVRTFLIPKIAAMVTLAWFMALKEAGAKPIIQVPK